MPEQHLFPMRALSFPKTLPPFKSALRKLDKRRLQNAALPQMFTEALALSKRLAQQDLKQAVARR